MIVEIIDRPAALLEIQAEWSAFARTIDRATPFQLPEWLLPWWRHFGGGELHVLLFREKGSMVGIIPLFLHEWNGRRQMTLIGSGVSDYLEPAIAPEHREAVIECLRVHLAANPNWETCNWQDLSFDTPLERLASEIREETPCSEIRLTGTFEEYWKSRSKSLRQNVRRDRQKAESLGACEFEMSKQPDAESMNALIQLHSARWQRQGEPGMIEANRSAGFLADIAREFADRDMLRIFALRFDGRIAAVILGFAYRDTLFNYLTAFDPQYEALGLGRALLFESLRYAFENGYASWDFLRGAEPYKSWWGARTIPKCRVIVTRTA